MIAQTIKLLKFRQIQQIREMFGIIILNNETVETSEAPFSSKKI